MATAKSKTKKKLKHLKKTKVKKKVKAKNSKDAAKKRAVKRKALGKSVKEVVTPEEQLPLPLTSNEQPEYENFESEPIEEDHPEIDPDEDEGLI